MPGRVARVAAERGLQVLLVDKKQELGAPIQCSGAISAHALSDVHITPDDEFVSTPIFGFTVYNATGQATQLDYRVLKLDQYQAAPLGYVVAPRIAAVRQVVMLTAPDASDADNDEGCKHAQSLSYA